MRVFLCSKTPQARKRSFLVSCPSHPLSVPLWCGEVALFLSSFKQHWRHTFQIRECGALNVSQRARFQISSPAVPKPLPYSGSPCQRENHLIASHPGAAQWSLASHFGSLFTPVLTICSSWAIRKQAAVCRPLLWGITSQNAVAHRKE